MDQKKTASPVTIKEDYPCPYFNDGRISTTEFLIPDTNHAENFHKLLAKGYRRIGQLFYRNVCGNCSACEPLRIKTHKFALSASQKRTIKRNEDVRVEICVPSTLTPEKVSLYKKYVTSKHANKKKDNGADPLPYLYALHSGYSRIIEMDYYIDNKLIGVGIVDESDDSLSSNYFYYDTEYLERRPGVFSILMEISLAKDLGKKYHYLGFYIKDNPKMAYKKYFRPNQIYTSNLWDEFLGIK